MNKLEDICSRIYYARIAMNSEAVKECLNEIDSYFRYLYKNCDHDIRTNKLTPTLDYTRCVKCGLVLK